MSIQPIPSQVITFIQNICPVPQEQKEKENNYILLRESLIDAIRINNG
jgi:hypothetical protein